MVGASAWRSSASAWSSSGTLETAPRTREGRGREAARVAGPGGGREAKREGWLEDREKLERSAFELAVFAKQMILLWSTNAFKKYPVEPGAA